MSGARMREQIEKTAPLRDIYSDTLLQMMKENDRVVCMEADVMSCSNTGQVFAAFPDRAINCGIQEANMIGVAAGMSSVGFVPFCHSFAPFVTRRVCDQVFMSAAYADLNVKIVGSDPGVTAQINGGTHMPFEDMGVLRSIPNITLVEPSDGTQLAWLMREMAGVHGVHYIRMERKASRKLYTDDSSFELGKGVTLREGSDLTIFATGAIMVFGALEAAKMLAEAGISARVVDLFTWKPMDRDLVARCAAETGAIVTAENHNLDGGFGSAVSEVLAETRPAPMERVGIEDRFGQVGTLDWLMKEYHLTPEYIVAAAKRAVERKRAR